MGDEVMGKRMITRNVAITLMACAFIVGCEGGSGSSGDKPEAVPSKYVYPADGATLTKAEWTGVLAWGPVLQRFAGGYVDTSPKYRVMTEKGVFRTRDPYLDGVPLGIGTHVWSVESRANSSASWKPLMSASFTLVGDDNVQEEVGGGL